MAKLTSILDLVNEVIDGGPENKYRTTYRHLIFAINKALTKRFYFVIKIL